MKVSDAGKSLIQEFEGLRLEAYNDGTGRWTIGYGHTKDVVQGMKISKAEADRLFDQDVDGMGFWVESAVMVSLTQGQFDALVSFTFNLGPARLMGSTLLKLVNAKDFTGAGDEFLKWCHEGDKVIPGLLKRRKVERIMFLT